MTASANLSGKTCVVTGANTGIGRATAEGLARAGGRVVLACRSAAKTEPVIEDLKRMSGNELVEHLPLDLSDLGSVREAVAVLAGRADPVDVIIANAGVAGQRGQTVQGFELAFGINHLGHFLFVTELMDLLREASPSRVVVVASESHYSAKGLSEQDLCRPTRTITGLREYERSKLANVLFAQELARRVSPDEVTTYALHPGVIASDIWRRVPWPVRPIMTRRMKTVAEGARTSLWCATDPGVAGTSGGYYSDCEPKEPSAVATPELGRWLWERSEDWTRDFRQGSPQL